jgi:hypothetical protein
VQTGDAMPGPFMTSTLIIEGVSLIDSGLCCVSRIPLQRSVFAVSYP